MVDYIDGFLYVEPCLHPWDEAYLVMMDDFSDVFLDLICQYCIENFYINVHEGYCLIISWSLLLRGEFASISSRAFSCDVNSLVCLFSSFFI
ncbi:hypothetical protein H671_2g6499 [Cricetulus griseus]|nr:hypothetical protein H671_2g6499 [Cricetulus griseus]